jgi:dTDP-4-amino-4,6-dideoxygalactose transaminase
MANDTKSGKATITWLDLKPQTELLREEYHAALDRVLDELIFSNGPAVADFEKEFASYCGVAECIAVDTGTSALHLAMLALGVGPGDEVITVSHSFIATVWPVLYLGARPVFVEVDPNYYTLDPSRLEAAITPRTKAIVPVHLYGQCADMDAILAVARAHQIPVVEDCAQAHGAEWRGRRAGSMGVIGCFSFYPSKNLGAIGEGGCLTTNDRSLAERLRRLRDHAQVRRYYHEEVGFNYRLETFQGAVLSLKLRYLESWIAKRQAIAAFYDRELAGCDIVLPKCREEARHVYHLYVIRDRNREQLLEGLRQRGIVAGVHYPRPIHLQPPLRALGWKEGDLPVTEQVCREVVSLPMYPELTEEQTERVVEAIRALR